MFGSLKFAVALTAAIVFASSYFSDARAGARLLFDVKTGEILNAENADDLWYPASLTKMMTAYVALKAVNNGRLTLDTLLEASANAARQPPSRIGIRAGQAIALRDALRLLFVKSANDIAVVVAEGLSGSVEAFARDMNIAAFQLGMTRSNFTNPSGLPDPEQVTTARDLARLSTALLTEFRDARTIYRLPFVRVGDGLVRSYNPLLGRYPGANGMKTGFVCASGFNFVGSAERDGRQVGVVLLGELSAAERRDAAVNLLDQAFAASRISGLTQNTLSDAISEGANNTPTNLRPKVCANGVLPVSSIPGGRATGDVNAAERVRYGAASQLAAFGYSFPVQEPLPRPSDIPVRETETVSANDAVIVATNDVGIGAETPISQSTIPVPRRRPAL
ncbi:MAG: D-alanyl-D-alanine carboxypeptidase family protein [Pseudomonadota bacterium]